MAPTVVRHRIDPGAAVRIVLLCDHDPTIARLAPYSIASFSMRHRMSMSIDATSRDATSIKQLAATAAPRDLVGVALEAEPREDASIAPRCRTSDEVPLSGHFEHPLDFRGRCAFRVVAVDPLRVLLRLEPSASPVPPGVVVQLRIAVPKHPKLFRVNARVTTSSSDESSGRPMWTVSALLVAPSPQLLRALGGYLVSDAGATPSSLRAAGFPRVPAGHHVRFRTLRAEDALRDVLAFRLRVHHADGVYTRSHDAAEMMDDLDDAALHVVARVGDRIVAAARIVHVGRNRRGSEHGRAGAPIPSAVCDAGFVETGRILVDPAYRGSGMFVRLLQELAVACALSGQPYVIGSCTDELLRAYEQVGFRSIGTFCNAHDPVRWNLLVARTRESLLGRDGSRAGWAFVLSPVLSHLYRQGLIHLAPSDRVRLACARGACAAAEWIQRVRSTLEEGAR